MSVESIFHVSPDVIKPLNGVSRPNISPQLPSMGERLLYSPDPFIMLWTENRLCSFFSITTFFFKYPLSFFLAVFTYLLLCTGQLRLELQTIVVPSISHQVLGP